MTLCVGAWRLRYRHRQLHSCPTSTSPSPSITPSTVSPSLHIPHFDLVFASGSRQGLYNGLSSFSPNPRRCVPLPSRRKPSLRYPSDRASDGSRARRVSVTQHTNHILPDLVGQKLLICPKDLRMVTVIHTPGIPSPLDVPLTRHM